MNNVPTTEPSISSMAAGLSPQHVTNLLFGGAIMTWSDEEESIRLYEQTVLALIEQLRGFVVANDLDLQKIMAMLTPCFNEQISEDLEQSFSRLEATALEHDTSVSIYTNESEITMVLWCCKNEDGTQVRYDDIYLPYNSLQDLGEDYCPKYLDTFLGGQRVAPIKAVRLYQNHKAEITDLNVKNSLRDFEEFFKYLIEYINLGLTNEEIVEALDNIDADTPELEVENTSNAPTPAPMLC